MTKTLKTKKTGIKTKPEPVGSRVPRDRKIILVGTYKEKQLAWIRKHGVYNYPVKDGDEFTPESFAAIKELWLYADVKCTRHAFAATFTGKMSREEFLAAHPTYASVGSRVPRDRGRAVSMKPPKTQHSAYYVFSVKPIVYESLDAAATVLARVSDFGGRSAKIKKAISEFQADGEFAPLSAYLPTDLAKVPREQLRVCEAAVQLFFWNIPNMKNLQPKVPFPAVENPKFTFIDLFAGIGGFRIAMQRCGGKCVFTSEFDEYAQKTYEANFGDVPSGDITKQETHGRFYIQKGEVKWRLSA